MFERLKITAFFLSIFTIFPLTASADFLAICGVSKGVAHYLAKSPNKEFKPFVDDGFSNMTLFLKFETNAGKKEYRIGYDDGSGGKFITHPTYLLSYNPSNSTYLFFVDASVESFTETYLFRLDGQKNSGSSKYPSISEVVWTQTRNGGTPKVVMMRAFCGSR